MLVETLCIVGLGTFSGGGASVDARVSTVVYARFGGIGGGSVVASWVGVRCGGGGVWQSAS